MNILAIETSCDETSAAILSNSEIKSNIISSQAQHGKYGGVVPELASRAHLKNISTVVKQALSEAGVSIKSIGAIAVTSQPGLVGSLIVGANFGKGLAIKYRLPIIPVNHIEGHLYSGCLQDPNLDFPFIALVVSGGHTSLFYVKSFSEYEILGSTLDDAAGEAFDKIASLLKLPYPGGPKIDKLSRQGNPKAYSFPRSMINSGDYNFSFSGLKTSVRYFLRDNFPKGVPDSKLNDVAASAQQAIVDQLTAKTVSAAKDYNVKSAIIAGGVSANSVLRKQMGTETKKIGVKTIAPDLLYCMDNAAMIAFIAEKKLSESDFDEFGNLKFRVSSSTIRARSNK